MNWILMCLAAMLAAVSCNGDKDINPSATQMKGIVLNEIACRPSADGDSWVELYNTTNEELSIDGLTIYYAVDQSDYSKLYTAPKNTKIAAGGYLVLSLSGGELHDAIDYSTSVELMAMSANNELVDSFSAESDLQRIALHKASGSYCRLPNGTDNWVVTPFATSGEENYGYRNRNAFWLWGTHMDSVPVETLIARGYGHIILNEAAFGSHTDQQVMDFIKRCEDLGAVVHLWFQCFYQNGEWISPIDDQNKCINQAYYDTTIARAERYVRMGIKGIHLDYIRYGGTAYKHDYETGASENSITEFCRQIEARVHAINPRVILSAALMPEKDSERYYGQNPEAMGQYIDILMPMIYRYGAGGKDSGASWSKNLANYFEEKGCKGKAEVWAGLTTYNYPGTVASGMSKEDILNDCSVFVDSKAMGIVLFRYGLGNFPDVNNLWNH